MIDNSSIDLSLTNLWRAWRAFRRGKRPSGAITRFEGELEANLLRLCADLNSGHYRHGGYDHKIVNEKKRRDIAVAGVRDRVVHRLLYDYLVPLVDRRLDFDVWSCRPGKGLHGALLRTQQLATRHAAGWVWRADIEKFFDHVNHQILHDCLLGLVPDGRAMELLDRVIDSYATCPFEQPFAGARFKRAGIPIGNLTSQIFANIYLHEFDRFVRHELRPLGYVRYGDDFVLFVEGRREAEQARTAAGAWLRAELQIRLHARNDVIVRPRQGLHFLGHRLYPRQAPRIDRALARKIDRTIDRRNVASYRAMHLAPRQRQRLPWLIRPVPPP